MNAFKTSIFQTFMNIRPSTPTPCIKMDVGGRAPIQKKRFLRFLNIFKKWNCLNTVQRFLDFPLNFWIFKNNTNSKILVCIFKNVHTRLNYIQNVQTNQKCSKKIYLFSFSKILQNVADFSTEFCIFCFDKFSEAWGGGNFDKFQ